ncbi:uncharacterized protein LOC114194099 isoform X2 [Vigna unguiculata]|uniref:uncharacterized protein LOC114194099 isoform X2 n=1 Tax=Vigna unguiculata TaxID=3917 RepID=UPI001016E4BA|nr:uncharacterized protein LOC114194099 isoform X2 [Vigna unguiculata]
MGAKDCFKSNIYDIVHDSNKRIAKRRVWKLSDYDMFFCRMLITMEEILTAEFLETMEFFVLDSLGHGRKKRTKIDNNVSCRMVIPNSMAIACHNTLLRTSNK